MDWKPQQELNGAGNAYPAEAASLTEDWNASIDLHPWEFEMDFWASLAEHPTLLDM